MIVGTTKLNYTELKKFVGRPQEIVAYCDSLVPMWARHLTPVVLNQRYYVAIHLRNVLSIPYKQREELVNALIGGVTLTGVMASFTSITDILEACDRTALIKMLEMKINGKE